MSKLTNPNSALYWLPRVQEMEIAIKPCFSAIPQTEVIPYDHGALIGKLEDGVPWDGWSGLLEESRKLCEKIGYPVFIRTDLSSSKHGGPDQYLARDVRQLPKVLCDTAADSEMKFWTDPRGGPLAFLLRKFITLDAFFFAFNDLPIGREWRFFASKDEVICAHPYWPEQAFEEHRTSRSDWREQLALLNVQPHPNEWEYLMEMAVQAAGAVSHEKFPRWSVDFARDVDCHWWLIDMAVMEESWHLPGCEHG